MVYSSIRIWTGWLMNWDSWTDTVLKKKNRMHKRSRVCPFLMPFFFFFAPFLLKTMYDDRVTTKWLWHEWRPQNNDMTMKLINWQQRSVEDMSSLMSIQFALYLVLANRARQCIRKAGGQKHCFKTLPTYGCGKGLQHEALTRNLVLPLTACQDFVQFSCVLACS